VVIRLISKVKRERVITRHMGNLKEAAPAMMVIILTDHSVTCKFASVFSFTFPIFLPLHASFFGLLCRSIRLERLEGFDYSAYVCGKKETRRNYPIKVWTFLAILTYVFGVLHIPMRI
jgi:hypothetical protein